MTTSNRNSCLMALSMVLFAMMGCSEGSLSGSLGDFYDLSFDHVRARLYSSELSIEYVKKNGEVPVRLTLKHVDLLSTATYDLQEWGDITGRQSHTEIPRLHEGTLTLDHYQKKNGGRVKGHFKTTLVTGKDKASLNGKFDTTLEIVEEERGRTPRIESDTSVDASIEDAW